MKTYPHLGPPFYRSMGFQAACWLYLKQVETQALNFVDWTMAAYGMREVLEEKMGHPFLR